MMKIFLAICFAFVLNISINAQSGTGSLSGFVAGSFKNGSAIDATVELRVIENHSGTKIVEKVRTTGGYYDFDVSFGYYLLTISADGYKTYQTRVYIPSSSSLKWATILEKSPVKTKKKKETDR